MHPIAEHYRKLLKTHGDSPAAAQYSSRQSQFRRFAALAQIDNLAGKRVLDFGCGTGAFSEYLDHVGQRPALYYGVDIVEEFFPYARFKRPDGIFCLPSELDNVRVDYSFVSGVFNNLRPDNRHFWQATVKELFAHSEKGIAFNLMSTYVDYKDPNLFYESPTLAFDYVKSCITPFVMLKHDYVLKDNSIPFEFAIYAYRCPVPLME